MHASVYAEPAYEVSVDRAHHSFGGRVTQEVPVLHGVPEVQATPDPGVEGVVLEGGERVVGALEATGLQDQPACRRRASWRTTSANGEVAAAWPLV